MSRRSWFTYDNHNDTHEDGYITIGGVSEHTGRSQRSETLTLNTIHGNGAASLTIQQSPADAFIQIDGIYDGNGNAVAALSASAFQEYWLVGTSNCPLLDVADQSTVAGTTLNESGVEPHSTGFTLIERGGVGPSHSGIPLNAAISPDYGASNSYQFKIPFLTNRNTGSERTITMSVYNTSLSLAAPYSITQSSGTIQNEGQEEI